MQKLVYRPLFAAVGMILLSACATTATKSESTGAGDAPTNTIVTASAEVKPQAGTPLASQVAAPNPAIIKFDAMSVKLDDDARKAMPDYAVRAKTARRIVTTGFCDHREVANAPDAAIARAIAVRDDLIRLGVPPANVHVKFNTAKPKKHAVEISFE
jgi:outer membrane protein OmpA-like peptidoglycan-associated protein